MKTDGRSFITAPVSPARSQQLAIAAAMLGLSKAELIRQAVDDFISQKIPGGLPEPAGQLRREEVRA